MNAIEIWDYEGEELKIDQAFQNLIPAISKQEREQLEANIVEFGGARDPLTVWLRSDDDYVLLDGHNRYEICKRLGLPFRCAVLHLNTRDEAADWIDRNQLGRRNLSKQDYKLLLGRRYNRAKKQHGGKREASGPNVHLPKTAERIAKEHGVDEKTVRRAGQFQAAAKKLGIENDLATGKVKARETAVIQAAKAIPKKATPQQVQVARDNLPARRKVSKQLENNRLQLKLMKLIRDIAHTVQKLDDNTSKKTNRRNDIAHELRRLADRLIPSVAVRRDEPQRPDLMLDEISYYALAFLDACPERADELEGLLLTWVSRCKQRVAKASSSPPPTT